MAEIREENFEQFVKEYCPFTAIGLSVGIRFPEYLDFKNEMVNLIADELVVLVNETTDKTNKEVSSEIIYRKEYSDSFYTTYKKQD
jgi:hypothetical protein